MESFKKSNGASVIFKTLTIFVSSFFLVSLFSLAAFAQPASTPPGGVVNAQFNKVTATTPSGTALTGTSGSGVSDRGVSGSGYMGVYGLGNFYGVYGDGLIAGVYGISPNWGGYFSQAGSNGVYLGTAGYSVDALGDIRSNTFVRAPQLCIGSDCRSSWPSGSGSGGSGGGSGGSGDVTDVNGGFGINVSAPGGPAPTVSVNTNEIQRRVAGTCASGQAIRVVNANGTVTCESVSSSGGGGLTGLNGGSGISVTDGAGPVPTVSTDFNAVQQRVNGSCPAGSSIRVISSNGAVTCEPDDVGAGSGGGDDGDWTISGNDIYRNTGNVSIGSAPNSAAKLNIQASNTYGLNVGNAGGVYGAYVSGGPYGLYANTTSGNGQAVAANAGGANAYGVYATANGNGGTGVQAIGNTYGVRSNAVSNGVHGTASASGGVGVYGIGTGSQAIGVRGQGGQWGGYFVGNFVGIYAKGASNNFAGSFDGAVTATQYCISGSNCISSWPGSGGSSNGTASAPAYSFSSDTNTGMYGTGSDILGFSTGGATRVTMSSNGTTINGAENTGTNAALIITSGSQNMYLDGNEIDSNSNPLALNYNNANMISLANGGGGVTIGSWASPGSNKLYVNGTAVKPGGGSWGASSDIRLKDVKGSYVYGLNEIMTLNPIWFNYKKNHPDNYDSSITYAGISAQEVKKVIPEAVAKDANGYYTLDANPIHWAAINAIKELKALFDGQSAEVEALKADNSALKSKVDALEVRLEALEATMQ